MPNTELPIAIIGGGPVGLAAAAHLVARGEDPVVFEAGPTVGAAVLDWGHVRLFSPWRYVVDEAAAGLLAENGWTAPDPDAFPTGRDLVERYLTPLAAAPDLRRRLRLGSRVTAVTRVGFDKLKTDGRDAAPFLLTVESAGGVGEGEPFLAKAVIDASGTWGTPNPLGASGVPAVGEAPLAARMAYGIPDVLGRDRARYAGRRTLVVGSGHSAFNVLIDLVDLAAGAPGTEITWAVRRPGNALQSLFGGGSNDQLPARGEIGGRVEALVAAGRLRLATGFKLARLTTTPNGIIAAGEDEALPPVDEIIAATGFGPNLTLLAELRLALDPALESPVALAPLIDPNVHSCGAVPPHGETELRHPESGVYVVGMKSYGRAPTFLMLKGYEQVRSVASALAGDWSAAREVRLVLPETGVCSTGILQERGIVGAHREGEGDAGASRDAAGPATIRLSPAVASVCCG